MTMSPLGAALAAYLVFVLALAIAGYLMGAPLVWVLAGTAAFIAGGVIFAADRVSRSADGSGGAQEGGPEQQSSKDG